MDNLDHYFTNTEFLDGLESVAEKRGYLIVRGRTVFDPGRCATGKEEHTEETWFVTTHQGKHLYKVKYVGEDSHFHDQRGKDAYKTSLLTLDGKVLLESAHFHVNTPESFSDDEEFPQRSGNYTAIYEQDELAQELFRNMQQHLSRKRMPKREALAVA